MHEVCPHCGKVSNEESPRFCSGCGARMDGKTPAGFPGYAGYSAPASEQKSPLIAAACSTLLPGLGQVYNGETAKGFILFILISFTGIISLLIPGQNGVGGDTISTGIVFQILGLATFIVPGIIWLYAIYNAHSTAGKMNRSEIPFREMRMLHAILFVVFAIAVVAIGVIIMYMMVIQPLMSQFGSLDMGNAGNLGNSNDINQLINNAGVF